MKRIVFLLLLVYASSILNVSELYAQKVNVGVITVIKEEEKIEKEKKEKKEKEKKEKKEKEQKEIKDYTHSVGITVASSFGFSYKYFFKKNLALKMDMTTNVLRGGDAYFNFGDFDFNPNVVYQMQIKTFKTCRLDFFCGLGTSFGGVYGGIDWSKESYCFEHETIFHNCVNEDNEGYWKFDRAGGPFIWGLNSIFGFEINLVVPMTIEFDCRLGYGLMSGPAAWSCDWWRMGYSDCKCNVAFYDYKNDSFFDWSANVTISYKF